MTQFKQTGQPDASRGQFLDIVFLTDKPDLPTEVASALRRKNLAYAVVPTSRYRLLDGESRLVATVIIDISALTIQRQQELPRLIEALQMRKIDVILLVPDGDGDGQRFQWAASKNSTALGKSVEAMTLSEVLGRVVGVDAATANLHPLHRRRTDIGSTPKVDDQHPTGPSATMNIGLDRLTDELRLARSVQRDFLPAQLPDCENLQWARSYEPAEWLSGDIYDATWIDEQRIGFYIADAVGHGVPAALLAIFVKQALAMRETIEYNFRIYSPAEVIENLNRVMCQQELSGHQFVTCCYGLLDVRTLQLTFARGGHPYPLLIRPGELPRPLQVRGSLLGIFDSAMFQQDTFQLQHGDKVLIYSDGAEPFIGHLDDRLGFVVQRSLLELADANVTELVGGLETIARQQRTADSGIDDVTILGVQVK